MINYTATTGNIPIIATAIHEGHQVRPQILPYFNLTEQEREREEDPHTGFLAKITDNTIIVETSRFETDLNRPRNKAVYQKPEDAWGLKLYKKSLPRKIVEQSLQNYDRFYIELDHYITELLEKNEWLIVYDLHSYNHKREGIDRFAEPDLNPEINLGTAHIDHSKWRAVLDRLVEVMRSYNYEGRHLNVQENVKFKGGYFTQWLFEKFRARICPVAIEFKKFFMDEWTGEVDHRQLIHLRQLLIDTIFPVLAEAKKIHL